MQRFQQLFSFLPQIQRPLRSLKTFTASNKAAIERLFQSWSSDVPIERAVTLPSEFYLSKDIFELERHAVFGQNWLWSGRLSQLNNVGDYIADRFLSEPYIINVDSKSNLQAHYNVCCHHGMQLVSNDQGQAKNEEFVCPYHGWTYDLNGRLKKALRLKGIENFKASKMHLKPISVQNVGPFVYINFNFSNSDSINNDLSYIKEIQTKYFQADGDDQLKFATRATYKINCNWKVFIDNYLDGGYHVPIAHRQLNSTLNMDEYKTIVENRKASVQSSTGRQRNEGKVIYAFIYPNLMINRYGSLMDINIVVPIDETNCLVHIDYFYCSQSMTKLDEEKLRVESEKVQHEDIYLCEKVQLGLASQAYNVGRYAPTVEHAMFSFHQTLYDEIHSFYRRTLS